MRLSWPLLLAAALCACGESGEERARAEADAELANAAALANEAAADEAADIEMFGGNAAAGETGNRMP